MRSYRSLFVKGARFRVIERARLQGFRPSGPGMQTGYGHELNEGDIITCEGPNAAFGSDSVTAVMWPDAGDKWICNFAIFYPHQSSMYDGMLPVLGMAEPLDAAEYAITEA